MNLIPPNPLFQSTDLAWGNWGEEIVVEQIVKLVEMDTFMKFK